MQKNYLNEHSYTVSIFMCVHSLNENLKAIQNYICPQSDFRKNTYAGTFFSLIEFLQGFGYVWIV